MMSVHPFPHTLTDLTDGCSPLNKDKLKDQNRQAKEILAGISGRIDSATSCDILGQGKTT